MAAHHLLIAASSSRSTTDIAMKVLIFCFILACASAAPLSDDLKWKSVDLDKDGQPDVAPLSDHSQSQINNDLQWKSVDLNKDGQPDVAPVVEEVKVADAPIADAPVATPAVEVVPVADAPAVEALPVAEEIKVADVAVVPVADAPVVEAVPVAEETKVVDVPAVPVADAPIVEAVPVAAEAAPEVEWKAPEPVQDTAEVQEAKAVFFQLYKEAADAAAAVDEEGNPTTADLATTERKTRQVVSYFNPSIVPYSLSAFSPVAHPLPYHAGFPYAFPLVYPTPVKNDRKKRQVALLPNQLYNDLIYKSVDLNQDGQPDQAVITTPKLVPSYLPFTGYPAYFPYAYPFTNGLHF